MNVLISVMTMLMLLSLMTYARLETYRSSAVYQLFFNKYMEDDERTYINAAMLKQYMKTKASKRDPKEAAADKQIAATLRISLKLLAEKKQRDSQPKDWEQTKLLLKNLIFVLYAEEPFFKQATHMSSQVLDELIAGLVQAVDDLPDDKKLKKAADLANITLPDQQLDELFYKMLHGAAYNEVIKPKLHKPKLQNHCLQRPEWQKPDIKRPEFNAQPSIDEATGVQYDEDENQKALEEDLDEAQKSEGYYSLLDFVNLSKYLKIRVYLASREVLQAIFRDKNIVDDVIAQRQALYKQALDDVAVNVLSQSFKELFEARRDPEIDPSMLDFSVSKTNPKNYE